MTFPQVTSAEINEIALPEITQRIVNNESRQSIRQWLSTEKGIVPRIIRYIFHPAQINSSQIRKRYEEASSAEINSIQKEFGILSSMIKAAPLLGPRSFGC